MLKNEGEKIVSKLEELPNAQKSEDKETAPSSGEDILNLPEDTQLVNYLSVVSVLVIFLRMMRFIVKLKTVHTPGRFRVKVTEMS